MVLRRGRRRFGEAFGHIAQRSLYTRAIRRMRMYAFLGNGDHVISIRSSAISYKRAISRRHTGIAASEVTEFSKPKSISDCGRCT